jgi:branched-chain amino acid aminotransferase
VASISFHLGTGVFDGMMAYWNRDHYYLHRAEDHLIRFRQGAACMGLVVPWSIEELLAGIVDLLKHEPEGTQYIRPIAFRGGPELWITGSEGRPVDVSIFTVRTEAHRDLDDPISCEISPIERISSRSIPGHIKVSGAYVNSFYARKAAEKSGHSDGLMFDRDGHLAEASAANVFLIMNDRLITPRVKPDVFPGITRRVLLEIARDSGIDVQEKELRREDLAGIDGALLCSTLMEIRGISQLGNRPLPTIELPLYRTLVDSFRTLTHQ